MGPRASVVSFVVLLLVVGLGGCSEPPDTFDRPTAVAFDPKTREIVVSDGYNHSRVARFSREGSFVSDFGRRGAGDGELRTPHGIAVDRAGRVYVADRENARVQVFDRDGDVLAVWGSEKVGRPWAIVVSADDFVYVVDGGDQDPSRPRGALVKLTTDGRVVARFATSAATGTNGLDGAHAVAVSASGDAVYVAESDGKRIRKLVPAKR